MKYIKSYKKYKESLLIDFQMMPSNVTIDILESMGIWQDALLSSIDAEEQDMYDILKLPRDFYKDKTDLDFLADNIEFINSLTSLALKKSSIQLSDDYQTFINKPCKWMFIYDINSNELEKPSYLLFQTWNNTNKKWEETKFFKVNSDSKKFYDKLASKTIEINDEDKNYIYSTSNGNDWELQNLDQENDTYKRYITKEELQGILDDKKVKISIL